MFKRSNTIANFQATKRDRYTIQVKLFRSVPRGKYLLQYHKYFLESPTKIIKLFNPYISWWAGNWFCYLTRKPLIIGLLSA